MKKKILLGVLILIGLFTITGCVKHNSKTNKNTGRIYNIVTLQDMGVDMFSSIIPEGWKATISSQNLVNSSYPFVETVVITNPDKSAKITILSQHSYTENTKYNEGENKDYYTTYLHQMDADTYMDYFMSNIYKGSTFVKEGDIDKGLASDVKKLQNLRMEQANKDKDTIGADNYGVHISIGDEGYTTTKREYQNEDTYYEASTSVLAISTNLKSDLSSVLDSRAVQWYMPYVIIYEGDTKKAYNKYYDDYKFIIANSNFTTDYYAMVEYVSSAIVNAYTSYYAAKSQAALDAMNDYIDSNYSSTSSASTNEKVMEMWDDVIKEQDNYILEDGTEIKTSIMNDTVAQNGDEIYIGSKAGIPNGFNEVTKGYK